MSRNDILRRAVALTFVSCLLAGPPPARAALDLGSETLIRWYEREERDGDDHTVFPVYEYLRLGYGNLDGDGLSFHAYGWGRHDFGGEYLEEELSGDRTEAELLYAFVEYNRRSYNILARLGRQYVFTGTSNESLDGVRVMSSLGPYFTADVYGGLPVSVEEVDGREGDRLWGGRLGHSWGTLYSVGLSYKKLRNDGDRVEDEVALDSFLNVPGPFSVSGLSTRSLVEDAWQEHSYVGRVTLGPLGADVTYERYDYKAYFDGGYDRSRLFGFLAESDETVNQWGVRAEYALTEALEVAGRFKHYDYRERDDTAQYYAAEATLYGDELTELGGEWGRMQGDEEENRYNLLRGYFYWDGEPAFLSGDVVYARYDEKILGECSSFFASLGTGMRFLEEEALEVTLSGDYSSDPYFEDDLRAMLTLSYRMSR